jgi:hypothetical protein
MRIVPLIGAIAMVAGTTSAVAQHANPSVHALVRGIMDDSHVRELEVRKLDVNVRFRGAIAETVMEMRVFATTGEPVEGRIHVDLPAGAIVTGYALDINGAMIDASLVDAPKAKAAYEQQLRKQVDPGLAEVDATGGFNTRVSPVDNKHGRTIRLQFVTPVGGEFRLPLQSPGANTDWSVRVTSDAGTELEARLGQRPLGPQGLTGTGKLDGLLSVAVRDMPSALPSRHPSGDLFWQASGALPQSSAARGGTIRVLWDRSRSRRDHDHEAEIRRVGEAIEALAPRRIEWLAFSSGTPERATLASAAELSAKAKGVRYAGATDFRTLGGMGSADTCLLVSDGRSTFGTVPSKPLPCRVFAIVGDRSADRAALGLLTSATGGQLVETGGEAVNWHAPAVEGVLDATGNTLSFVTLPAPAGHWSIAFRAPASGPVRVRVAGTSVERRPSAAAAAATFSGEGTLVAAAELARLGETADRKQFVDMSRRYSIASQSLSFIVLETPEDYVRSDIAPPANYPKRAIWSELRKEADEDAEAAKASRFDALLRQWQEQVAWWERKFDINARPPSPPGRKAGAMPPGAVPAPMVTSPVVNSPAPPPPPRPPAAERDGDDSAEIVVSGVRGALSEVRPVRRRANSVVDSITANEVGSFPDGNVAEGMQRVPGVQVDRAEDVQVSVAAWRPDRDYLDAFDADPASFDRLFAEWDRKGGDVPSFYLDTADWLMRHEQRQLAIQTALSALDLPTANLVTVGMVAARLERYGALDDAVALRERQMQLDPDRPQPARAFALALAKRAALGGATARADYERAVRLLVRIALEPIDDRWAGIDLISLVEANALLPRLRALGGNVDLDRRLTRNLDSDVRVVIDWSNDDADIDLWVDEPNGERAIYSNNRTLIGGHLSNDMTDGYGPEEYFLRRAAPGRYVVRANVFAPDQLDPNGPSRVTAHLFRDWGRPGQREESIDVELKRGQSGEVRIGTLSVAEPAR